MSDDVDGAGAWEQHEGDTDMPEYAVAHNKGWDAGIKQGGAEVLAAVSKHWLDMDEGLCACGWESKGETWAEHILALQPAASSLEALLREEWNKAVEAAANTAWVYMVAPGKYDEDDVAVEIRALSKEKARAEGKG